MKFWRIGIFTLLIFISAVTIVLHSSCERNVCDNVTCFNGGACNQSGTCTCPVGFEGPQCAIQSSSYFIGTYVGLNTCDDNGSPVPGTAEIDSVQITQAGNVDFVNVAINTNRTIQYITGYISDNDAIYSIIVATDSSADYIQRYTITLQGNTNLTINTYSWKVQHESGGDDTTIQNCYFKGTKL